MSNYMYIFQFLFAKNYDYITPHRIQIFKITIKNNFNYIDFNVKNSNVFFNKYNNLNHHICNHHKIDLAIAKEI